LLDEFKPHVLLHCAAERRPDKLEGNEEWAMKINAELTDHIAELCKDRNIWMVYMSTNYVFDGKDAPYKEDDNTNPVNTYGVSKLAGETKMHDTYENGAILRVPLLYGPTDSLDESSVTQVFKNVKQSVDAKVKVDNWQQRYPTYTPDVANVLEAFSSAYYKNIVAKDNNADKKKFGGVFQWQAPEMHTKFTMAKIIAKIANISEDGLVSVDDGPGPNAAPRPHYEAMTCAKLEAILKEYDEPAFKKTGYATGFEKSIEEVLAKFVAPEAKAAPEKDAY
jgi:S-adenosylmethionine synthetase